MTTEADIVDAIVATGAFQTVSYLIAESTQDAAPIAKPFFILGGAQRNAESFRTFCGPALIVKEYQAIIGAEKSADLENLIIQATTAVAGIVRVSDVVDDYDEEGGFYFSTLTMTTL